MKRTLGKKSTSLAHGFAVVMLASAPFLSPASASNEEVVRTASGVSYISGGIGTDSTDRLSSLASAYNLKLVFALNSGEYVSDVRVAIANAAGKTLLDATSEGPWLLTRLPPGNYRIVATFADHAVTRQVAVGATNLRTVDFRWVSE